MQQQGVNNKAAINWNKFIFSVPNLIIIQLFNFNFSYIILLYLF